MFKCEIKGIKETTNRINKLSDAVHKYTRIGLENALENAQKTALRYKRGGSSDKYIPIQILYDDKKIIVGRIYTDKTVFSYAAFMEYGTGIYAELEHIGKTKTFLASGYQYWLLPVDKADRDFGSDRITVINGNMYYVMYSQQSSPFMRPTAFEIRDKNVEIIKEALRQGIKEVTV